MLRNRGGTPTPVGRQVLNPRLNPGRDLRGNQRQTQSSRRLRVGADPDENFTRALEAEQAFNQEVFRPQLRELVDEVDSTELVDEAKAVAGTRAEQAEERSNRQLRRFGVTPAAFARERNQVDDNFSKALSSDGLINRARFKQDQRNRGLRDELVNISRGVANSATDSLSQAASLQNQREITNDNIDAQNDAARNQLFGQLGGAALSAAFLAF